LSIFNLLVALNQLNSELPKWKLACTFNPSII